MKIQKYSTPGKYVAGLWTKDHGYLCAFGKNHTEALTELMKQLIWLYE